MLIVIEPFRLRLNSISDHGHRLFYHRFLLFANSILSAQDFTMDGDRNRVGLSYAILHPILYQVHFVYSLLVENNISFVVEFVHSWLKSNTVKIVAYIYEIDEVDDVLFSYRAYEPIVFVLIWYLFWVKCLKVKSITAKCVRYLNARLK